MKSKLTPLAWLRLSLLSLFLGLIVGLVSIPTQTRAADISVTAGSVIPDAGYTYEDGVAGATITRGQVVYKDASDSNKYKLASTASAAASNIRGIALQDVATGQALRIMTGGTITIGGTTASGTIYVASDNAGGIAVSSDNGSGDYVCVVGVGISTTKIKMGIVWANAAK